MKPKRKPIRGTTSLNKYLKYFFDLSSFLSVFVSSFNNNEESSENARKALYKIAKMNNDKEEMIRHRKKRKTGKELQFYRRNFQLLIEMFIVKCIENYLTYISNLTNEIYLSKPESLKSEKQVSIEDVLCHKDLDSFIKDWVTKKVESLSYYSFDEIYDHYKKKFNISLVGKKDYKFLKKSIAFRNISVHNRGIADQRYIEEAYLKKSQIGKRILYSKVDAMRLVSVLLKNTSSIDKISIHKFKLKTVRLK